MMLSSCGCHTLGDWLVEYQTPDNGNYYYKDIPSNPELIAYAKDYPGYNGIKIVFDDKLREKHDKQPNKFIGTCFSYYDGHREIGIYSSWWEEEREQRRKLLIWHELGHCVDNLKHDDSTTFVTITEPGSPNTIKIAYYNSIMSTYIWPWFDIATICQQNPNIDKITQIFCQSIESLNDEK